MEHPLDFGRKREAVNLTNAKYLLYCKKALAVLAYAVNASELKMRCLFFPTTKHSKS